MTGFCRPNQPAGYYKAKLGFEQVTTDPVTCSVTPGNEYPVQLLVHEVGPHTLDIIAAEEERIRQKMEKKRMALVA